MLIQLKKFGSTLSSRPAGKEAFLAFRPSLNEMKEGERIDIDFEGVLVLGPSWADEFIIPIFEKYKSGVFLHNTENPSVKATLELLAEIKRD